MDYSVTSYVEVTRKIGVPLTQPFSWDFPLSTNQLLGMPHVWKPRVWSLGVFFNICPPHRGLALDLPIQEIRSLQFSAVRLSL